MTPSVTAAVAIVKIISSLVTETGKLVAVSAAKAAGDAIHVLLAAMFVPVVVFIRPVVFVAVPRAKVALAPLSVSVH